MPSVREGIRHALGAALVLFGSVAIVAASYGQPARVEGRVTDARTGDRLEEVSIQVRDTHLAATTDERGRYHVSLPPGRHALRFRKPGYQTIERHVVARPGLTQRVNVDMEPDRRQAPAEE